jgi:hypothetical protein
MMATTVARAVPALQLDIIGGTYDSVTQTVISDGPSFTLLALATATADTSAADILAGTYYISAALSPVEQSSNFDAGSFSIDGNVTQATDTGMTYGTPPIDAAFKSDNLAGHGVFPTYYQEVEFQFDSDDTTTTYNSEDDTGGGLFDENGYGSFYVQLEIDVSGLVGKSLHFDLYNTDVKNDGSTFIDAFAPFSHDAQSLLGLVVEDDSENNETPVPEPSSSLILITGLGLCWAVRRRQAAAARILATTAA